MSDQVLAAPGRGAREHVTPRQVLVPLAAGLVCFLVAGFVLIASVSTRHEGAEPESVIFGLLTIGPWWIVLAWLPFLGGAVLAGWLARFVRPVSTGAFVALFAGILGTLTMLAAAFVGAVFPAGVIALAAIGAIALGAATLAYPLPRGGVRRAAPR